jgi:hypothetical protein
MPANRDCRRQGRRHSLRAPHGGIVEALRDLFGGFAKFENEAVGISANTIGKNALAVIVRRVVQQVALRLDDKSRSLCSIDGFPNFDAMQLNIVGACDADMIDNTENGTGPQNGIYRAHHTHGRIGACAVVDVVEVQCRDACIE